MTSLLGTRLKAARKAKGYGLHQVAKLSGVSASNISRVERGGNMYVESFIALAKCYDVSADELADNVSKDFDTDAILQGYLAEIAHARAELGNLLDGLERVARALVEVAQ